MVTPSALWQLSKKLFLVSVLLAATCATITSIKGHLLVQPLDVPGIALTAASRVGKDISHIVELPDGSYVGKASQTLYYRPFNSDVWQTFVLNPDCKLITYSSLTMLPTGEVAIIETCSGENEDRVSSFDNYVKTMWALDPVGGNHRTLTTVDLPGNGPFSWDPSMERAIFNNTIYGYGTLFWLTSETIEPVELTIVEGQKQWYLPDSIQARKNYVDAATYPVGLVRSPAWSPDGNHIAFWVSLEPQNKGYHGLADYQYNLYLVNPETTEIRTLLSDVLNPGNTRWSPNGRFLAYISEGSSRTSGIWLYDTKNHESHYVRRGSFYSLNWATDGTTLLVVECIDSCLQRLEIRRYDVSSLMQ